MFGEPIRIDLLLNSKFLKLRKTTRKRGFYLVHEKLKKKYFVLFSGNQMGYDKM